MNAFYKETHSVFDCSSISEAIALCRENLGDTNPYELLQKRKWFTFPGGELYIRKDCLDHSIITFFALKNHEQHR